MVGNRNDRPATGIVRRLRRFAAWAAGLLLIVCVVAFISAVAAYGATAKSIWGQAGLLHALDLVELQKIRAFLDTGEIESARNTLASCIEWKETQVRVCMRLGNTRWSSDIKGLLRVHGIEPPAVREPGATVGEEPPTLKP